MALRGSRSQTAWSRRLGYRSNVAYAWESGRRWPTAAETFRACGRAHIDVEASLTRFYGTRPAWLDTFDPSTPEGIAAFLDDLRGSTSITDSPKTVVSADTRCLAGLDAPSRGCPTSFS